MGYTVRAFMGNFQELSVHLEAEGLSTAMPWHLLHWTSEGLQF